MRALPNFSPFGVYAGPEVWEGNLSLRAFPKITSLGTLKRVKGNIYGNECANLESLGNLEEIEGSFDLVDTPKLTSLGNLMSVNNLYLDSTILKRVSTDLEIRGFISIGRGTLVPAGISDSVSVHTRASFRLTDLPDARVHQSGITAGDYRAGIKKVLEAPLTDLSRMLATATTFKPFITERLKNGKQ